MRRATQRLITDVHSKGIARGAVESINLLTRRNDHDVLAAECFRTFRTITFPGAELLQREEVVRDDLERGSVTVSVNVRKTWYGVRAVVHAPMDLLYGFRPRQPSLWGLSPYEFHSWWGSMAVTPPHVRSSVCQFVHLSLIP